jgi:uncharacterized protein YhbP (UPF0306 family)
MEKKIAAYISQNKVLTLATSVNNIPYCANCFYAYDKENEILVFLSDESTFHVQEAIKNNTVAGTIQNGETEVAKLQGIQLKGDFVDPTGEQMESFYETYYREFPFAKEMPSPVWGLKLNWVKMADNTLGFGTKLVWER